MLPLIPYLRRINIDLPTLVKREAFQMYPSAIDIGSMFNDLLHNLKWNSFAIIYDTRAAYSMVQNVIYRSTLNEWTIELFQITHSNIDNILHSMRSIGITHTLIYTEDDRKAIEILNKANEQNMLDYKHRWIIGNLDPVLPLITIVNKIASRGTNLVIFRMQVASDLPPGNTEWTFSQKLANDAMLAVGYAIEGYLNDGNSLPGNTEIPACQRLGSETTDGKLMEYIAGVSFSGLTGNVTFNDKKQRRGYMIEIYSGFGIPTNELRGMWSPQDGLEMYDVTLPVSGDNNTLIVSTIQSGPFLEYNEIDSEGEKLEDNDRFTGYIADIVKEMADRLGYDYELRLVADGNFGRLDIETGTWNGMIGEIIRKESDVAAGPITISAVRETVIDFTIPFKDGVLSVLTKSWVPTKSSPKTISSFLRPLQAGVWVMIFVALFAVSLVIFIMDRFNPFELRAMAERGEVPANQGYYFSGYLNCVWYLWSTLFLQSFDYSPRSMAGRCMSGFWFVFVVVTLFMYLGNMSAILINEPTKDLESKGPINNLEELISRLDDMVIGAVDGGRTIEYLKESSKKHHQKLWSNIEYNIDNSDNQVRISNITHGIQRVRESDGKYAFVVESAAIDYALSQPPCDLVAISEPLDSVSYGFAVAEGAPLREHLNIVIMQMKEDGFMEETYSKWFQSGPCGHGNDDVPVPMEKTTYQRMVDSLDLKKFAGLYIMLLVGIVLSLLVGIIEFSVDKMFTDRGGKYNVGKTKEKGATIEERRRMRDEREEREHSV
ncbi:glutamate receptor 3-like [Saccoglossus kowalevskii]|uniref:Glutamate receptor 3-like n=1 Tax=Saccoglossus kowalevskii TaxID=10224 RepID=A0ABM0GK27_SACKO|nr:PREDICTED: glutamate receptor 3-like [Saccoglossus kowalevskii]